MMCNRMAASQIYSLSFQSKLNRPPFINISKPETRVLVSITSSENFVERKALLNLFYPSHSFTTTCKRMWMVESAFLACFPWIHMGYSFTSFKSMAKCFFYLTGFPQPNYIKQDSSPSHDPLSHFPPTFLMYLLDVQLPPLEFKLSESRDFSSLMITSLELRTVPGTQ